MKKHNNFFHWLSMLIILTVVILSGCQQNTTNELNKLEAAFKEQGINIKKEPTNSDNLFEGKLNGVRPQLYKIEDNELVVYVFKSTEKKDKGYEEFLKKVETYNTVDYEVYQVRNLLIFFIPDMSSPLDDNLHKKIKDIIIDL